MDILIFLSEFMVPLSIFYIVGFGLLAGRPVFDDFLKGAIEGMKTVAGILPTLIGLMAAVGILRASGLLEAASEFLKIPAARLHIPIPLVPVILVRMVSSSAATGLILDIFKEYGPDSLVGNMVSIMMGCTETIFYTMSVYFMSAGIRKTRWTLPGALFATAGGIAASIFLAGWMGQV
ncbi:MAG: spore maturation protein [Lachnospiraceae bacterium]|jgi:spore maturation protein B|nr:spore maturation protein [Lachnospiraceae bacterium]